MPDCVLNRDAYQTLGIYLDLVVSHEMIPPFLFSLATIIKRKADVVSWDFASRKTKTQRNKVIFSRSHRLLAQLGLEPRSLESWPSLLSTGLKIKICPRGTKAKILKYWYQIYKTRIRVLRSFTFLPKVQR